MVKLSWNLSKLTLISLCKTRKIALKIYGKIGLKVTGIWNLQKQF